MADSIKIYTYGVDSIKVGSVIVNAVYVGNAKVYPLGQSFDVCYAVVDDISQYSETDYTDVYNLADEKWYKLNNLNQYEQYGIYGSGRTITYYEGKLTIDDGYEYEWNGSSWVNLGEVTGSSRVPIGYTEVEYVQNNTQGAYINTGLLLYDATGNSFSISAKLKSQYESTWKGDGYYLQTIINSEDVSSPYYGFTFRYAYQTHNLECVSNPSNSVSFSSTANADGTLSLTISCNSTTVTSQVPLGLFASYQRNYNTPYRFSNATIYSFQVTKNNTLVRDFVPCKRDSDSMVGLYDLVNDVFYYPPNYSSYQLIAGSETGIQIYPLYYDEMQDPPNNVSFSSMTEAEEYECPWVGMIAIIDGVDYIFSGDSTSGYEWVEKPQPTTTWYTLQDLIDTRTVVNKGNNRYGFDPVVNGIAYFRVHTDKVSGSNTYVDLYNDNLPSPPYFGIKDDNNIELYTSVDGYSSLKAAANSSTCTWAYWIDANTIEVNAQAIMNDTMQIGYYTGSFSKLLLSFELPAV